MKRFSILGLLAAILTLVTHAELLITTGEPLFFRGEKRETATARLLRIPAEAPKIWSADGAVPYESGRDFTWRPDSREITLTPDSRIPFMTSAQLHPAPNSPNSYKAQRGTEQWMFFGPGRVMHDLQPLASYTSAEEWQPPQTPPAPEAQLGALRARLAAKQPLKLVVLGDSISTGADASALSNVPPMQPGYPDLVARGIEARFGAKVALTNLSVGGEDSAWGKTRVDSVIAEKPDLLLLAFGMNDASGKRTPADFAKITRETFEPIRAALPDCTVILVAPMTANSEWSHSAPKLYPLYAAELAKLTGASVAFANITATWTAIVERKHHLDLSGNGLNHPNDYGHRMYADVILATIGGGK